MASSRTVIVQRSGTLYLVGDQAEALAVDLDRGTVTDIQEAQSLVAHILTNEDWEVLGSDDELPDLVRSAVEQFKRHIA